MEKEKQIKIEIPVNVTIEGEIDLRVLKHIIDILKDVDVEIEKISLDKD